MARFPWMIAGASPARLAFPLLWAKFGRGGISSGAMFGFLIGLLVHAGTLFLYVSMPISGQIAASWFIAGGDPGDGAGRARGCDLQSGCDQLAEATPSNAEAGNGRSAVPRRTRSGPGRALRRRF
jgi:hypothetical protein